MAAFLLGGCSAPEMKGTPFYTGKYELDIPDADVNRVNLWPLAYYREPVLSVLWPIFEKTEEHMALRPMLSAYGDTEDYWEYNFLWPLGQWDSRLNENRLVPYFWGKTHRPGDDAQNYNILFPLWWHFEDELDTLIPLWFVRHSNWQSGQFTEHNRWFCGPLAHAFNSPAEFNWHVALFGHSEDRTRESAIDCLPFPLYISWRDKTERGLFTPLYTHNEQLEDGRQGWSAVPPLLSLHTWNSEKDDRWLGGPLFRVCGGSELNAWHALLFARYRYLSDDSQYAGYPYPLIFSWRDHLGHGFFTPLYAFWEEDGPGPPKKCSVVPFLLSWHSQDPERSSYWFAGPLGHYCSDKEGTAWHAGPFGRIRNASTQATYSGYPWPLLFSWESPQRKGLFTPAFASWENTASTEPDGWSFSLPLLSWHIWSAGEDGYFLGGPLAHLKTGGANPSWHVGLFGRYYDAPSQASYSGYPWPLLFSWENPKRQGFFSPLYAYQQDNATGAVSGRSILPPLLYWHSWTATEDDHWLLGPLAHRRTGEELEGWHIGPFGRYRKPKTDKAYSGYPWPLVFSWQSPQERGFFSPLYGYQRDISHGGDDGWGALPLLLAWRSWGKSRDDVYGLLGLFSEHRSNAIRYGHLLPFYDYDQRKHRFYSPLFGWRDPDAAGKNGFWYPFTPLVGIRTGEERGGWAFPFYFHRDTPTSPDYSTYFLLLGYADHTEKNELTSKASETNWGFLPFYCHAYEAFTNSATAWDSRMESYSHDDYAFLLGYDLRKKTVRYAPRGEPPPAGTNSADRIRLQSWHESKARGDVVSRSETKGFFPFWMSWSASEKRLDGTLLSRSADTKALLILYDKKVRFAAATGTSKSEDYQRQRILWRAWNYRRCNGDITVDLFPFITRDVHKDGLRKTSFLWRFYRYQKDPDGKTSVDLFFIPVWRD